MAPAAVCACQALNAFLYGMKRRLPPAPPAAPDDDVAAAQQKVRARARYLNDNLSNKNGRGGNRRGGRFNQLFVARARAGLRPAARFRLGVNPRGARAPAPRPRPRAMPRAGARRAPAAPPPPAPAGRRRAGPG